MQMKRYQMYLEPKAVQTIDLLSQGIGISRSRLIQDVVSRVVREYVKVLTAAASFRLKNNPLLKMAGFAKGLPSNLSQNIDEIYLKD